MSEKINLDVAATAERAREISLEAAKKNPGTIVGPLEAFISEVLIYLSIREALKEVEAPWRAAMPDRKD